MFFIFFGVKNDEDETGVQTSQRARRARKSIPNKDDLQANESKPPQGKKRTQKSRASNTFIPNVGILEGLEDDIIEMEEEKKYASDRDQFASDLSQRELLNNNNENMVKSVPTDKFYLELENKFAIQNKQMYEKRENERLAQLFESQLKQKQKDDLRYQISTPRTALYTHKFLRLIFLFINGLNVGFQGWHAILIYFLNTYDFKLNTSIDSTQSLTSNELSLMILFENLTMPIHCLSYFFLVICIVDCMDR